MSDRTVVEIDEQIALCRQRFAQTVDQLRTVLAADVAAFPAREARRAFLAAPEVSQGLSDEQVSDLKRRATEAGTRAAERLAEALADPEAWFIAEPPREATRLDQSEAVWSHVVAVEEDVRALLEPLGLVSEPSAPRYRAPVYFVKGLYLPTLAEHYWKLLAELADLAEAKARISTDKVRERLGSRWDEA